MHEQVAAILLGFLLLGLAFYLGFDLGSKGQQRKTKQVLKRYGTLAEQVKAWRSSPNGTAYSRGYSEGYTDCLSQLSVHLERHTSDEPT